MRFDKKIHGEKAILIKALAFALLLCLAVQSFAFARQGGSQAQTTASEKAESAKKDAPEGMVFIPAGEFTMGTSPDAKYADERHLHRVVLDAFYMDKYEVTNQQFCDFLNVKGNQEEAERAWLQIEDEECRIEKRDGRFVPKPGYENHPVVEVNWYGARAYAEWAGKRLPTEAEWEYACRAGTRTEYYVGNTITHDDANFEGKGGKDEWEGKTLGSYVGTSPVGSFAPNPWGLYDMHGNVWEWCSDWYDRDYYEVSPTENPQGPPSGTWKVCRGGSWSRDASMMRSGNRHDNFPLNSYSYLGFRCVKDAE